MNTIILFVVGFLIVLIVRNSAHAKQAFAGVGQAMRGVMGSIRTESGNNLKWMWSLLLVIVGIVVAYWVYHSSLRPADVGSFGYDKSLFLVVVWIVVEILIAINLDEKKTAKCQKILRWAMLALLVALPLWSWIVTPTVPHPQQSARAEVPLTSMSKSSWPEMVTPAGAKSRFIPLPLGMFNITTVGIGSGKYALINVYRNGRECVAGNSCPDGEVTGYFIRNEDVEEKTVLYAFSPIAR